MAVYIHHRPKDFCIGAALAQILKALRIFGKTLPDFNLPNDDVHPNKVQHDIQARLKQTNALKQQQTPF